MICHSFDFCVAFYMDGGTAATTSIFIIASATDWLDGYIARKVLAHSLQFISNPNGFSFSLFFLLNLQFPMQMKLKSTFGAFLDPVADKVFRIPFLLNCKL